MLNGNGQCHADSLDGQRPTQIGNEKQPFEEQYFAKQFTTGPLELGVAQKACNGDEWGLALAGPFVGQKPRRSKKPNQPAVIGVNGLKRHGKSRVGFLVAQELILSLLRNELKNDEENANEEEWSVRGGGVDRGWWPLRVQEWGCGGGSLHLGN